MKAAQKITVFFLTSVLLAHTNNSLAQTLDGKYLFIEAGGDSGKTFSFNNGLFTYYESGDVQGSKGLGRYSLTTGWLYLDYTIVPDKDTSEYNIVSKAWRGDGTLFNLKIKEENGLPIPAMINFLDSNKRAIASSYEFKDTLSTLIIPDHSPVKFIGISAWLYYSITLPVAGFSGKSLDVAVRLLPATVYYIPPHKEDFQIKELTENSFILVSKNKSEYRFYRIE